VRARVGITRQRSLSVIKRLRADFTGVVHAHQACCVTALPGIQAGGRKIFAWGGAAGDGGSAHRIEGALHAGQEVVERR